jgi:hypothetical protein
LKENHPWGHGQALPSSSSWVYNLAADMGGKGFIKTNWADCMLSVLINTNMLMAAQRHGVRRLRPEFDWLC